MTEHEFNYCPNCSFDLAMHRELLRHQNQKMRMRIYEEVKAELEAQKELTPQLQISPPRVAIAEPASKAKISVTETLIGQIKNLRDIREDGRPLRLEEIASRANIPLPTVKYIVYFILKKRAQKHTHTK